MTRAYGEIDVADDSAIVFKKEILGFEGKLLYYLLEMKELPNFYWLQSKEDSNLAFVVLDPRMFKDDYELTIDDIDKSMLELEDGDEIIDFVIANIPDDPSKMSINLLGPIVVNVNKKLAIQAISMRDDYDTKYHVFKDEEQLKKATAT